LSRAEQGLAGFSRVGRVSRLAEAGLAGSVIIARQAGSVWSASGLVCQGLAVRPSYGSSRGSAGSAGSKKTAGPGHRVHSTSYMVHLGQLVVRSRSVIPARLSNKRSAGSAGQGQGPVKIAGLRGPGRSIAMHSRAQQVTSAGARSERDEGQQVSRAQEGLQIR
jgi:hypothetical protein